MFTDLKTGIEKINKLVNEGKTCEIFDGSGWSLRFCPAKNLYGTPSGTGSIERGLKSLNGINHGNLIDNYPQWKIGVVEL